MVGGQYADVSARTPPGPAALRRLHELKTGRLIGASVLCVLLLTGTPTDLRPHPFRRFAAELGVLFQIVDDILDVTGTDDALGKPRGSDERHGKRTYVSEFGIERARELAAESHRIARAALAELSQRRTVRAGATAELEEITDFIYTTDLMSLLDNDRTAARTCTSSPSRSSRQLAAGGARAHHRHRR